MLRWPSPVDRGAMMLVAVLCAVGPAPLAAQQSTSPAPATGANPATPSAQTAPLPGPRVQPEYRSFQPSVTDSSASGRASSLSSGRHTIVLSTLSLVLIIVIIVLLVAR